MLDKVVRMFKRPVGFDKVFFDKVTVISAGNGSCVAEFKVEQEHTNPMGGLHGGLSATIVDSVSSIALRTLLDELVHVSVKIDVSFMKGASLGDEIIVNARTVKAGKSLAFLEVELKNKKTGDLLVTATHTKFITDKKFPWPQ